MSERNDGGPAFPRPASDTDSQDGMTLRDYFAAHAPPYPFKLPEIRLSDNEDPAAKVANAIARWNWYYADAMLNERTKGK